MIAFLRELEQSLRMFDVTGLQLSPAEDATGAYTFAVTMETYWVDETAAKASQQAAVDNLQNI